MGRNSRGLQSIIHRVTTNFVTSWVEILEVCTLQLTIIMSPFNSVTFHCFKRNSPNEFSNRKEDAAVKSLFLFVVDG